MKNYQELITEIFNRPASWKYVGETKYSIDSLKDFVNHKYSFSIDKHNYVIWIGILIKDKEEIEYDVSFELMNGTNFGTLEKTGTGNEFKVFATVIDLIKYKVKQNPSVKKIKFSADKDERSRVSLYTKMVRKMIPSEWKVKVTQDDTTTIFTLTRK